MELLSRKTGGRGSLFLSFSFPDEQGRGAGRTRVRAGGRGALSRLGWWLGSVPWEQQRDRMREPIDEESCCQL